jgi:hypothetical protein
MRAQRRSFVQVLPWRIGGLTALGPCVEYVELALDDVGNALGQQLAERVGGAVDERAYRRLVAQIGADGGDS